MQRAKQEEKERPRRGGRPCVGLGNLIPARFYERSSWNKRYRNKDASMFVPISNRSIVGTSCVVESMDDRDEIVSNDLYQLKSILHDDSLSNNYR